MRHQLKYFQSVFYDLLNDFGKAYIVVRHSDKTSIGKRGFTEEEKKAGLVLVFTRENHRNLAWLGDGSMSVNLAFGTSRTGEECLIFADDMVSVYSPDAMVRFDRWDFLDEERLPEEEEAKKPSASGNVVSFQEFKKTRRS